MNTFDLVRRHGSGAILKNARTMQFFKVSDYSPATRDVYGWPASNAGEAIGRYQKLPATELELA